MNRRKLQKLIDKNSNINNNFNEINKRIDYSKYDSTPRSSKLVTLFTNRKFLISFSSILILAIALPLLNNFNIPNSLIGSSSVENNASIPNVNSSITNVNSYITITCGASSIIENVTSSEHYAPSASESSNVTSNVVSSSSSSSSVFSSLIEVVLVSGEIKLDSKDNKMFYTSNNDYKGYYSLEYAVLKDYVYEDNFFYPSEGNEVKGTDLPIGLELKAYLEIDGNNIQVIELFL